jgi:ribosomal protein S18 acetylase RimI-like enzyme
MRSVTSHPEPRELTIARATVADVAVVARAAAVMFEQAFGDANTREDMAAYVSQAFSEDRVRSDLEDDRNFIWIAREPLRAAIVGYAQMRPGAPAGQVIEAQRCAEISRLYTDRAWHGRGLGAVLMRACVGGARASGAGAVWLGVWEHNARAIAFYEKHGFKTIGEQQFMLGSDRQRDLVMALDIKKAL